MCATRRGIVRPAGEPLCRLHPEPPAEVGHARHLEPGLCSQRRLLIAARQSPPHPKPGKGVLDLVERAERREDARPLAPPAAGLGRRPANLQGVGGIVQLGYVQIDCSAQTSCNGIPDDGQPHFAYTPYDNTSGVFTYATWFQNGNPTKGHKYRFEITQIFTGSNRWNYCIYDLTSGGFGCTNTQRSWSNGNTAWWGYEAKRTTDALGVRLFLDSAIAMQDLQWSNTNNVWTRKTGAGMCQGYIGPLSYYGCSTSTTTYANDTINGYTVDH